MVHFELENRLLAVKDRRWNVFLNRRSRCAIQSNKILVSVISIDSFSFQISTQWPPMYIAASSKCHWISGSSDVLIILYGHVQKSRQRAVEPRMKQMKSCLKSKCRIFVEECTISSVNHREQEHVWPSLYQEEFEYFLLHPLIWITHIAIPVSLCWMDHREQSRLFEMRDYHIIPFISMNCNYECEDWKVTSSGIWTKRGRQSIFVTICSEIDISEPEIKCKSTSLANEYVIVLVENQVQIVKWNEISQDK
jgi:hypothetical protein